ncbi:MAG: glycoside hydrolase family 5 protein [Streptococcaceae bacterium]|jgi:hypothetical protein|nr:glycoside hydrolase family 5 protein [Streptococcaceae bacterium]
MGKVVNGYIHSENKRLVNDKGEIILKGWGIGNWLLCEGYMWQYADSSRMDRPRRIEEVISELIGMKAAEKFWRAYRENYFTREDVKRLKAQGYNSIRLPINSRLFLEDEPELVFKEEGFEIVDKVIKWCQEEDLYVWIDMHGAPGGQTGANIDDSIDDMPRLFMDEDKFQKGLALWEVIAKRYADNPVVAGYDLLNEPIRPKDLSRDVPSCENLVPRLIDFYKEAIRRIRAVDKWHCIALEGHHWATDTTIFNQQYDSNWLIHFHRYWDNPEEEIFQPFLELREKYNVPLWLGETGENTLEWFSAISSICDQLHISYHFWPYKKMGSKSCSAEIKVPEDWQKIIDYSKKGQKPVFEKAQKILDSFLEGIKLANCQLHDETDASILRNGAYTVKANSFGENPSFLKANPKNANIVGYKTNAGIELSLSPKIERNDDLTQLGNWVSYDIVLYAGETVSYAKPNFDFKRLVLVISKIYEPSDFEILGEIFEAVDEAGEVVLENFDNKSTNIELSCLKGKIQIESLRFE